MRGLEFNKERGPVHIGTIPLEGGIEYDVEKGVLKKDDKVIISFSGRNIQGTIFKRLALGGIGNLVTSPYLEKGIIDSGLQSTLRTNVFRLNKLLNEHDLPFTVKSVLNQGYFLDKVSNQVQH